MLDNLCPCLKKAWIFLFVNVMVPEVEDDDEVTYHPKEIGGLAAISPFACNRAASVLIEVTYHPKMKGRKNSVLTNRIHLKGQISDLRMALTMSCLCIKMTSFPLIGRGKSR